MAFSGNFFPLFDQGAIDKAIAELLDAVTDVGVIRPPQPRISYTSFLDPSGGAADSFTCATAHNDNGTAVLDCLVEIKAPFNPDSVTVDLAGALKSYGLNKTTADRYAAQWMVAAFARHGITLTYSERDRSQIYLDTLPLFS